MGDENAETIPGTRRPDGSLRKPVRVKKGYVPPEEQDTYDRWKDTSPPVGVIGADVADEKPKTQAGKKNEKRKDKKKTVDTLKETDTVEGNDAQTNKALDTAANGDAEKAAEGPESIAVDTGTNEPSEVEKKIKALKKRLRQIDDLAAKATGGVTLNDDQAAKVAARGEVEAEINKWESLGDLDVGKKVKALRKKIRQIQDLEDKAKSGVEMNEDQKEKIDAKKDLLAECEVLEALALQ